MTLQSLGPLDRLNQAFRPHRPIELPQFLSGRVQLLYRAMDAIDTTGLHLILFGDRGIGKTSIARVLAHLTQQPEESNGRRALLTSCSSEDTYPSIWRKVFQEIFLAERQLGLAQEGVLRVTGRLDSETSLESPNDVRLLVQSLPHPYVIIIDEFDRVPLDNNTRRLMADTIKMFSDYGVETKIIVVGVAESIGELIAEHLSIARNTAQIQVEPLSTVELAEIIQRGFSWVGMEFEPGLDMRIAQLSQGYPSYAHLLGLWSGRRTAEKSSIHVQQHDLDEAIPQALDNVAGGVLQEFETAVDSGQPGNLFKEVLLACALAPKDSVGRFSAGAVRDPLRKILGRPIDIGGYQSHLAKFCTIERGPILRKTGTRKNYRWRFVNPQIVPFIRLMGVRSGWITDSGEPVRPSISNVVV